MHAQSRTLLQVWSFVLLFTLFGCSGPVDPTGQPTATPTPTPTSSPEQTAQIAEVLQHNADYFDDLIELTATEDVETAKETVAADIAANDENVEWAEATERGILIQYENGGRSAIIN